MPAVRDELMMRDQSKLSVRAPARPVKLRQIDGDVGIQFIRAPQQPSRLPDLSTCFWNHLGVGCGLEGIAGESRQRLLLAVCRLHAGVG